MDDVEIEHRLTAVEQRASSNTHRLDKVEPIIQEIHTMSKTMVQLVGEVKHTNDAVSSLNEKVDHMDGRVDAMERAPADDVKRYRSTAVTAIISVLAGAMAAGLIGMIANYI